MSRKTRFGCQGNVISPLMQRLWSSRNHFLKSAQNSDLETTLKPFALRHMIKSGSSLGLIGPIDLSLFSSCEASIEPHTGNTDLPSFRSGDSHHRLTESGNVLGVFPRDVERLDSSVRVRLANIRTYITAARRAVEIDNMGHASPPPAGRGRGDSRTLTAPQTPWKRTMQAAWFEVECLSTI